MLQLKTRVLPRYSFNGNYFGLRMEAEVSIQPGSLNNWRYYMFSSLISFHTFDTNILPFLLRSFLLFILHIRQFAEIIAGEESVLLFIWFS